MTNSNGYFEPEWAGSKAGYCWVGIDGTVWHLKGCDGHIELPDGTDGIHRA